jgi:hypothetical protein
VDEILEVTCPSCCRTVCCEEAGELECPHCDWEFAIDADGEVVEGELDWGWELEIDADGELVCTRTAEVEGPEGDEEECEDEEMRLEREGPVDARCPNCRQYLRDVWLGEVECSRCRWLFTVDHEEDEEVKEEAEEAACLSFEGRREAPRRDEGPGLFDHLEAVLPFRRAEEDDLQPLYVEARDER